MDLKSYLKKAGKTQIQAANEIGITQAYFNFIANGKVVPGRKLSKKIEQWSEQNVQAIDLLFPTSK